MTSNQFYSGREGLEYQRKDRVYPTGCKLFNLSIGKFDPITKEPGIPAGTGIEVFGPNASLKTALWESLAANMHRIDKKAKVFAVLPEAPEFDRFESVGMDMDRIHCWTYRNPKNPGEVSSAEEGLDLLTSIVREDESYKLVIVDSIKALMSVDQVFAKNTKTDELKALMETQPMVARAKLMNDFIGRFAVANVSANAILFMTNQMTESIGPNYLTGGNIKTKSSGGREKEHFCKIRVEANSTVPDATEKLLEHATFKNKIYNRYRTIYFLEKNKFGFPLRKTITDFDLDGKRFMNERACLNAADLLGIIEHKGSYYTLEGNKIQGHAAAEAYLLANPKYEEKLWKEIYPRHVEFFGTAKAKSAKEALDE
jgi:RecA/RadA recombinase